MFTIELYKKGVGTLYKFKSVNTFDQATIILNAYCKEFNVHVVKLEHEDAIWCNCLSDGTELDFEYVG